MATEEEIQDSIEEEVDQPQQTAMDALQLPLVPNALLSNQRMDNNSPLLANGLITHFPYHFPPPFLNCQHFQHQQRLMQQDRQFQMFWANQLQDMKASTDFRSHNLPLARIKKIMKADEDVKMIAAETLELFSRACEMFILELTHRSWSQVEHNKRRTLQRSDISSAIAKHQMFDFLIDIVPMEEVRDERVPTIPENEELNESIRSFYDPSRFGAFMVDMRRPEMVPHGLSFTQQQQDHNASEKDGTNSTENDSK